MILVDASVWIDHIRQADEILLSLLDREEVLTHPFVIGEVAVGDFRNRQMVLAELQEFPRAVIADHDHVLYFIATHRLFGRGIGYVDVHLLAATRLTPGAALWTHDRRLREAAEELGLAARLVR